MATPSQDVRTSSSLAPFHITAEDLRRLARYHAKPLLSHWHLPPDARREAENELVAEFFLGACQGAEVADANRPTARNFILKRALWAMLSHFRKERLRRERAGPSLYAAAHMEDGEGYFLDTLPNADSDAARPDAAPARAETTRLACSAVRTVVEKFTPLDRRIFNWRFVHGETYEAIGRREGLTGEAIRYHVKKITETLRHAVAVAHPEISFEVGDALS